MTRTDAWQLADIPDQAGRTVVVTGTTLGGLGHHTALELARRGARVVLAGPQPGAAPRDPRRPSAREVPAAELEQLEVDLSDLASVRRAGEAATALGPIDVLVNNAGVMGTSREITRDGLDLQLATNHFGPFLLTGLLLPQLLASKDARVVTVSSNMHRVARSAPLDDPRVHHGRYAQVARLRADQAGQPALHLRARPPGPRARSCRCGRWPRTRASPAPTSPPTASTAARPAASPRSSTRASRPSRSRPRTAPGRC